MTSLIQLGGFSLYLRETLLHGTALLHGTVDVVSPTLLHGTALSSTLPGLLLKGTKGCTAAQNLTAGSAPEGFAAQHVRQEPQA